MKKTICFILFVFMLAFGLVVPMPETTAFAENAMPEITSKSAYLVDYQTGTVVFEKNADERLPIASMTKLASLSVVFDYLSKGIIKENDLVTVTETAAAVGGSSAFLDADKSSCSFIVKALSLKSLIPTR